MKTIKFIGAAIALALVPATAFAAADCCAGKECCKDGADCCKDKDGAKKDCCADMRDMKHGEHAGHDMSGMQKK